MKVLVTGANGYLGKGIVKQLLDDGIGVIATDIRGDGLDSRAEIIIEDMFSLEDPYNYYGKPDVLLHLAWRNGFVHNSPTHINDLSGHYDFICKMIDGGLSQVAIMGSMHEIGFFEGSIDENTPCNPQSLYGISKNALRQLTELKCKSTGCTFQWLRGFYIVGNTLDGSSIFSKIAVAEKEGKTEFPFTTGLNQYDFLDYENFCKYVAHTVEQSEINGIVNICSGRPEKLSDRVERFIKENNYSIKLDYGKFPDRPYDSKALWGNNQKILAIEYNRSKKEKECSND